VESTRGVFAAIVRWGSSSPVNWSLRTPRGTGSQGLLQRCASSLPLVCVCMRLPDNEPAPLFCCPVLRARGPDDGNRGAGAVRGQAYLAKLPIGPVPAALGFIISHSLPFLSETRRLRDDTRPPPSAASSQGQLLDLIEVTSSSRR